ncbi:uncharacterized protein LOC129779870 [Toxorhynchites rutilus septentrionalis]|uniref:uncharacterized protein LOC129779870 n=1 Tax=Toxorhynchites rutilus septentrionalis TaxID=329112 RepID=UPI0024790552|nr:uncharacterized protein LOC129779870 [Toxorhynchites rutilus septentrionalis]
MNILKKCCLCQQPADLMCSRCLEVYCSVECQIRDWSEHKKICIVVPKLYPNDSYLNILAGGVTLPLKSSSLIEQASTRMLQNNSRSLKPLRKPNIPVRTVEMSVNRENTAKLPHGNGDNNDPKDGHNSVKELRITAAEDCDKPFTRPTIEEISPSEQSSHFDKPKSHFLATRKLEIVQRKQTATKSDNSMKESEPNACAPATTANSQTKPWMLHFPITVKDGEFFEVIVEYVVPDQPKRAWVILASHEVECDKLLRDIHGQLNPNGDLIAYDAIQLDDIYAAPFEDIYYRAVVLAKIEPANVRIRLIDYGNDLIIPASALRAPLLLMKNLRRFAFEIEIQNLTQPLEVYEHLRINVVGSEGDCKVVEMEKDVSIDYLIDSLGSGEETIGSGGIIAIFTPTKSLVMLSNAAIRPLMKVLYSELLEVAPKFSSAKNPKEGDLICIDCFGVGWSRGLIIAQHDTNQIIYTVDNGSFEVVSNEENIRALPTQYMSKPHLVLQMSICKIVMNEQEFRRLCYSSGFAFNFERLGYDKQRRVLKGMLKDAEGKRSLAEVEFSEFVCDVKQVGIRYWSAIPEDKCAVRITSVLSANKVIICQQDKINVYTEMMQTILPTLKPLEALPSADDVVVGVDDIMMPYRALVMRTGSSNNEIELLDLDNGCIKNVMFGKLYHANNFISNLPVHTLNVEISDLNLSIVKDCEIVRLQLDSYKTDKRAFRLLTETGSSTHAVKLIDTTTNRSLATILMEHHNMRLREADEAARKQREADEATREKREQEEAAAQRAIAAAEAQAKAAQDRLEREKAEAHALELQERMAKVEIDPKPTATEKFYINNLMMIELPAGKSGVKLTILDDGDVTRGVLTVCEANDENVERYNKLTDQVNKHVACIDGDGYCPELDELCVAIFDADNLWYRAVCVKPQPEQNTFLVQFIDYGNVASVKREFIRKLTQQLNFPCAAHTCAINEMDKQQTTIGKLAEQQSQLGYVIAKEIRSEGEIYSLTF